MGLFLTVLFILTAYLEPQILISNLAQFHVEIIIAVFALVASLFTSSEWGLFKMPQTFALIALCCAVFLSIVMNGWLSGGLYAMYDFLPSAFAFFFIAMNCRKKSHLQVVIYTLVFVCFFVIANGFMALHAGNYTSPYLLMMHSGSGTDFYRLRGLGFINDPNDFSQLLVGLIPCVFFLWKSGKTFLNLVRVVLPVSILIFGLYLSHSRGAMLAMLVIVILAARRKIGTIPSVAIAAALFALVMVIGWTGGRNVSVEAGEDRLDAWSVGLQLIKHHPLFGVGYEQFGNYYHITAHNTVVVCAAEIGIIGLFCWIVYVFSTLRESLLLSEDPKEALPSKEDQAKLLNAPWITAQATPAVDLPRAFRPPAYMPKMATASAIESSPIASGSKGVSNSLAFRPEMTDTDQPLAESEIRRLARLMVLSLSGFLVAGWFLSRAYQMTLFILAGFVAVIYRIAAEEGFAPSRMPVRRLLKLSFFLSIGLVMLVYIMLRIQHMVPAWN